MDAGFFQSDRSIYFQTNSNTHMESMRDILKLAKTPPASLSFPFCCLLPLLHFATSIVAILFWK